MGVKDQGLQEYLKDNERFADFMNGTLFAGKQIVDPCYLKEVQRKKRVSYKQSIMAKNIQKKNSSEKYGEEEIAREKGVFEEGEFGDDSAKLMYLERERDFLRLHDKPGCRFLLACEVESGANYEMPVRCFTYDSIEYTDQLKEWKRKSQQMFWGRGKRGKKRRRIRRPLLPVFHQVLYLGEKRWKSKLKLQEMMDIPENVMSFSDRLPDYDICMIDIHEQNPELFHTEWKDIFQLMKHSRKKDELRKYVEESTEEIRKLSQETRWLLAILLEQYEFVDEEVVEVKDMCKAWDGAMQMYADEARAATRKEMKKEMKKEMRRQAREKDRRTVFNMFSRGYSQKEIAAISELPLKKVQKMLETTPNLVVCISEGIHDKNGTFVCELAGDIGTDTFGHKMLTGSGKYLENLVKERIGVKVRSIELNVCQRCSSEYLSATDLNESENAGIVGVQAALKGETGKMITFIRNCDLPYELSYETADVNEICNMEKAVPSDWITEDGCDVTEAFIQYARPLIQGKVVVPEENGLPLFAYRK